MKELIAKSLVDHPEAVEVNEIEARGLGSTNASR